MFDRKGTIGYLWEMLPEKYHLDEIDVFLLRKTLYIGLKLMDKIITLGLIEEFIEELKRERDGIINTFQGVF